MPQDRDEPVQSFSAQLRGQANVYKSLIICSSCSLDSAMSILCFVMHSFVVSTKTKIRLGILSEQNQEMTLEQVLQFVEAKKAGKRSQLSSLFNQAPRLHTLALPAVPISARNATTSSTLIKSPVVIVDEKGTAAQLHHRYGRSSVLHLITNALIAKTSSCLLYTSPSPRD